MTTTQVSLPGDLFRDAAPRPLVSVILPVYNGGEYLAESIRSILSQSYDNFEFIIVDDGSVDDTAATVASFHDQRLRFVRQENRGLPATLNVAIGMSRGDYLARQDADDAAHPTRLQKQVAFLEENPRCGVVGTWSTIFEEGRMTQRGHRHPTGSPALAFCLLFDSYFVHSSVMLRRSVFSEVGLYCTERSRQPEDYELWSRILRSRRFEFANLPERLVIYREVPSSICRSGAIDFQEHVAYLAAENLAWAAGLAEPDMVCLDTAALLHGARRRLSPHPDLADMLGLVRKALAKVSGGTRGDPELMQAFDAISRTLRNEYLKHRYGSRLARLFVILSDLIGRGRGGRAHGLPGADGCVPAASGNLRGEAPGSEPGAGNAEASVDVVIPVYNGERYIANALRSVLGQTVLPRKIVVVDDGSTDRTRERVASFASPVPLLYLAKENGGPSSARNAGIARCDSDYIAFLDADDEWLPWKLEEQMGVFRRDPRGELGVVYGGYALIGQNGDRRADSFVAPDPALRGEVFWRLLRENRICGSCSAVVVRRECLERVGGFDEAFCNCEDWDLWLRIAQFYQFDFVPRELVLIRCHPANNQKDTFRMFNSRIKFYNKWIERLPYDADCFEEWRRLCITYLVTQKPRVRFYAAVTDNLSAENRRKFFGPSLGSLPLGIALSLPKILLGMLKYRLTASEVPR